MQYKVPQNIDQEDKILGPLTFIQFIYVLIGGAIVILSLALFDTALFLLIAVPTIILTACFALVKVQDQPFSRFFVSFFVYLLQPKRRIWHDAEEEARLKQQAVEAAEAAALAKKQAKKKAKDIAPAMSTVKNAKAEPTIAKATPRRSMDTIGVNRAATGVTAATPSPATPTDALNVSIQPSVVQPTQPASTTVQPTKQPTLVTVQGGR